ncbi:MAG TPA: tRNA (guanosine(46)-N7)-methyltransferase TrmB [Chthoniobacterales bacterium]|nr:tRNA (guanosine(46)-N7)-methyltransferase TrmB [Chthoniobacterales bacterium]
MATAPSTIAAKAELIPENYFAPLDFEAIYGNRAPLEVDLGCGDGLFLAAAAAANPARNFLGIERMPGRVRSTSRKIEAGGLANARILELEIWYSVRHLLPAASVAVFHLMFPDPWPKRRHSLRRVVTEDFLVALHRALAPNGLLRIATDETDYFREIERLADRALGFTRVPDQETPVSVSTFEKRFRQDGQEIHRLVLRKVSPSKNGTASQ